MRVVVAMSGGVDSSVAALLLKEAGHDVIGVFLRNGVEAPAPAGPVSGGPRKLAHGCCGATDALDAEEVAGLLGIPFHALDHAASFRRIIDDFVAAWARGETPNPCVQCNRELKFGELFRFAHAMGAQRVATGHYARVHAVDGEGGGVRLERGRDRAKDQSYVLATVAPAALRRALFPIGELEKEEVRARAHRAGLPVHAKPESQEICFVPSGDHRDLLRARRPDLFRAGPIVDEVGTRIGTHGGAAGFTVGQRRGLQIALGTPRYVLATDPATNRVTIGPKPALLQLRCVLHDAQWLAPPPADGAERPLELQVRAHHRPVAARARASAPDRPHCIDVALDPPGVEVPPGQIGVLYDGEQVVGAGRLGIA